jgi:hypothetical protein
MVGSLFHLEPSPAGFKEVVTGSTRAWFLEHKLCVPHRRFKALVERIEPKVEPSDDHLRKKFPKYMDECMVRIGKGGVFMGLGLRSWLPRPTGSEFLEQPPLQGTYGRVNQPPWLHQLAVPSTGWATVLHRVPHTALTNIGPQSNLFSCWPLTFLFSRYFPNLTFALPPSYPPDLVTLTTYLPIYQPTFLTTCILGYLHTCLLNPSTYMLTYLPAHLPTYHLHNANICRWI